jgi:hypothetical protein
MITAHPKYLVPHRNPGDIMCRQSTVPVLGQHVYACVYAHALHSGYLINTLIDKYPYNKLFSFQAVLHEFLIVN